MVRVFNHAECPISRHLHKCDCSPYELLGLKAALCIDIGRISDVTPSALVFAEPSLEQPKPFTCTSCMWIEGRPQYPRASLPFLRRTCYRWEH